MATFTAGQLGPRLGIGTSVSAYLRSQWQGGVLSGAPSGAAVAGPVTIDTNGNATFTGLAADTEYVVYAGTPDRYTSFWTGTGGVSPNARDIEVVNPVKPPVGWSVVHAPAANAQATATRAAVAGVSHVCEGIHASLSAAVAPAAAFAGELVLRDGATGVGTVLWQEQIVIPAAIGGPPPINIGGLSIDGTAGNAMTLEFTAAGGANVVERVTLVGFDR